MIIIIQCAASKQPDAGHLMSAGCKPVVFVADPEAAPANSTHIYARPDDLSESGKSWRQVLLDYNHERAKDNPLGLLPAGRLYKNEIYARLVDRFGPGKVYILSAGWGLIRADFLTPYYDITFSQSAEGFKRRRRKDRYRDLRMLSDYPEDDEIVFFGGKDYLPLLCALTGVISDKKTVFYNSAHEPQVPGWTLKRFATRTRTNWHYECADDFLRSG